MALSVMVTVDLNNVDGDQRKTFNEEMKKRQWVKLQKLTTTWKTTFQEGATVSGVERTTKQDVDECAKVANIKSWDAALMVGQGTPVLF